MTFKAINIKCKAILDSYKNLTLPVNIEEIARLVGVNVMPSALENDISGILVIEDNIATIGYNQHESRVRRRFTIAHELGHFILHKDQSQLFLDKGFKVMFRPSSNGDKSNSRIEQEANVFASCILMPDTFVQAEIQNMEFDLGSEESIKLLSKKFDVSTTAMYYKILNLKKA